MDDKLLIKISIGDRHYPVNISRGDSKREEIIRNAANEINETVLKFKKIGYKNRDEQDYLAMASLQFVVKSLETEDREDAAPLANRIREMDRKLEELLNKE